ncbi:MAG: radical SAM protein [Archangium sp.]|nr:radical SAM protein [Archangium sp.]
MRRITVAFGCATPCPSCIACSRSGQEPTVDALLADEASSLVLGGGDATRYRGLGELLERNRVSKAPRQLWLEAPARSLDGPMLERLHARGLHGVVVQIEAMGEAMCKALKVGDGEQVIAAAEALGLETQARLCVRPKTFPIVAPLAQRLAPRTVWLELVRQDWGQEERPIPSAAIETALLALPNLQLSSYRLKGRGYLPPCALPRARERRPALFRHALRERGVANTALPACEGCSLRTQCDWNDPGALDEQALSTLRPVAKGELEAERRHFENQAVPPAIVAKRRGPEVVCTTPWTTMEVVDPDGRTRQCCSTWTVGDRGNAKVNSLAEVWNGAGYRAARRVMSGTELKSLCNAICSRLYDLRFSESALRIQSGSKVFVDNQLLLAEDIAERREETRGKPLYLAICPSTYCNYNCIMCDHGRSPRRELPERIFDELPGLFPTLKNLTLLGGEPLANPRVMQLLREFDVEQFPDTAIDLVTNGSLLTAKVLKHLTKCTLGDVTVSVNAGTPEVYQQVQRGLPMAQLLENLDALIEFRRTHHRWFGITLSFVLQPASAHTVLQFAQLAHERNLRIRLMAMNPENHEGLDFYVEPDRVEGVLHHAGQLVAFCERNRPEWLGEARAGLSAVKEEAARRRAGGAVRVGQT